MSLGVAPSLHISPRGKSRLHGRLRCTRYGRWRRVELAHRLLKSTQLPPSLSTSRTRGFYDIAHRCAVERTSVLKTCVFRLIRLGGLVSIALAFAVPVGAQTLPPVSIGAGLRSSFAHTEPDGPAEG